MSLGSPGGRVGLGNGSGVWIEERMFSLDCDCQGVW